tara:strand:+ start:67 stop:237 length:171 start_codon:yes stop_codon:yes gene_type:complete
MIKQINGRLSRRYPINTTICKVKGCPYIVRYRVGYPTHLPIDNAPYPLYNKNITIN